MNALNAARDATRRAARRAALMAAIALAAGGALWAQEAVGIPGLSADGALAKSDSILSPDSCFFRVRMTNHKPGKTDQVMDFDSWYKKDVGSAMEITAPARTKGTRILQLDDAMWMYSPRSNSGNAIRLSPRDAFQGSAFSNNDVGDHNYSDNYACEWTAPADVTGGVTVVTDGVSRDCAVVTGTARDNKAPYGKILVWLEKDSCMPVKMNYYTRSGLLYRVVTLSGIKQMAGAMRPTVLRVETTDGEGAWSSIEYLDMDATTPVPDSRFTRAWLTR